MQALRPDRRTSVLHGGEIMPAGAEDLPEAATMAALFRY